MFLYLCFIFVFLSNFCCVKYEWMARINPHVMMHLLYQEMEINCLFQMSSSSLACDNGLIAE